MVLKAEPMVRMIVVKADTGILCVLDRRCFDRRIVITFRLTRRVTDVGVAIDAGDIVTRWGI